MTSRSLYITLITGLLLLGTFFATVSVGFGIGISSPQLHFIMYARPLEEPLAPGMTDVPINFTLINANNFALYDVNISAFSVYPFTLINYYNNTQNTSILQWNPGQVINVIYYYNINTSASNGVYNISLKVAGPISIFHKFHETVNASVAILGYTRASVQAVWGSPSSPQLVAPGDNNVPITLIIDNQGNVEMSNASLLLTSTYPIKFMQNYLNIGYLPPGQPIEVTTYASVYPNATTGVYQVPAQIQYFSHSRITTTISIPITGYANFSATTIWGSTSNPLVAGAGSARLPLTIILNNLGDVNVDNVSITFPQNEFPLHFLQTSGYLGIIPAGLYSETTLTVSVYSNASPGVYYVKGTINYFDEKQTIYVPVAILGYTRASVQAVWGSPSSPQLVAPGDNNVPITLIIDNQGNVEMSNASLLLTSTYPIKFMQNYLNIGYLPPGQPIEVTTYASVYPNATTGVYQVPAQIQYFSGKEVISTFITVPIVGYETFSVSSVWGSTSSPLTAAPGQTNLPLTFIVRNLGDVNALNVSLYVSSSEFPIQFTQNSLMIGIVPAGQINEGTITVNVYPNATPGTYYIPVIMHYSQVNVTEYVPVTVYPPKIALSLFTVPPQVFPGFYDVRVEGVITNYGTAAAQNSYVLLQSPFPVISQNNLTIGAIPPGVPINVSFLINVPDSVSPGQYHLNFTVFYDGGSYTKSYSLTVYPKANLTIVKVIYPSLQAGDTKVPITLIVKNVGNATAKNVKAILGTSDVIYPHVSSSNPLQGLTASESSLGDIGPGQEINVTYVVDVSGGASVGSYPLTLTLVWNQTGSLVPFVQNDHFFVTVTPPLTSVIVQNPAFYIAIVVVIIIIVVVLILLRRKK
ncbi:MULTISPECIES: COG1361 S-layer family protein [Metallosphaera]|nr:MULTISPECIES: S-layer protein [Metallosphaera]AKV73709.1 S-layer protein [Metallosphaera sedula]AKV75949.1 S-layer protein [Metallosphaera sedula]AKV78200.1 S-layer protein [Metallosphaera sedula]AKV80445.1 S-layer protein [Metallosphaera sedula]AKV82692.1 S-layer protein [Metallosphaera sedula]